jgi:alkanesulfonate monooxygenase SsuD/methylene tetrahydromethanopterin reductase-like flavin-dependent oxidoreductase (luciferase family)
LRVIVMDLLAYGENLDYLKGDETELAWPLAKEFVKPEVAAKTYAEHLDCWVELEKYGFDGVAVNEHHTSPYGLMNSPNLLAAAISQRTEKLKILIYGNLLPIHDPLRLAEELAMLDCISGGRIISGFARGIPREHTVFGVSMSESRARFEEAAEVIRRAWTDEVLNFDGTYYHYHDVAIWPRPLQQPHPPIWMPITSSKESIEFAARNNISITPGAPPGLREDIVAYYEKQLAESGFERTPDHIILAADPHVAATKEEAVKELAPYRLYFNRTLFSHGNATEASIQHDTGYLSSAAFDYIRPENLHLAARAREEYRGDTIEHLYEQAPRMPWGSPDDVAAKLIADADATGSNIVIVNMNRGAMPKELFMEQIHRFGTDVLPQLHAHEVTV